MDWPSAARKLDKEIDWARFADRFSDHASKDATLYVACSGGADSVYALLSVWLWAEKQTESPGVVALHFDHALRGTESTADHAFVRSLCADLGISLLSGKAGWEVNPASVSEAMARAARLRFFRDATHASENSPRAIVTGHHADDAVETQLMRLSRGSGLDGLIAPREVSEAGGGLVFLRPLLAFSRAEIRTSLESAGIRWREDSSNESGVNYRSRLRASVIPAWNDAADRAIRPGCLRSRQLLEDDAIALEKWAERARDELWNEVEQSYPLKSFSALPRAIQRRLLHGMSGFEQARAAVTDLALQKIADGAAASIEIERGIHLELGDFFLRVRTEAQERPAFEWEAFKLPIGCKAYLPDGAWVAIDRLAGDGRFFAGQNLRDNDDNKSAYLSDLGNLESSLTVRRRQPGDAFKPLGKSSGKKLKTLLIDRKIERGERDRLPVFASQKLGILWMPGLPPCADCKLGLEDEAALRLTYGR